MLHYFRIYDSINNTVSHAEYFSENRHTTEGASTHPIEILEIVARHPSNHNPTVVFKKKV